MTSAAAAIVMPVARRDAGNTRQRNAPGGSSATLNSRPLAIAARLIPRSRHSPTRPGTNHWNASSATPAMNVVSTGRTSVDRSRWWIHAR